MRTPLLLAEQINVVAATAVSQAIQVVFFTAGLFAFFLALGVIAIPDDVIVLWSAEESCSVGEPPCAGRWFGIHTPVPQTVVNVVLLVAVLSGLYFTVTSVDPHTSNWRTPAPVPSSHDRLRLTGTGPGSTRCRSPSTRSTTCR